jgi:hypothetical protein
MVMEAGDNTTCSPSLGGVIESDLIVRRGRPCAGDKSDTSSPWLAQ